MNQLLTIAKTFVGGHETLLESLYDMIKRQSQEQVSRILLCE